jgi:two-component system, NarL family, response regulator NreC
MDNPEEIQSLSKALNISKISIVLAEDHSVVRSGLRILLERQPNLEIIGEASDGIEAVRITQKLGPDILILDISMAGLHGLDVARQLMHRKLKTRIVVLSMHVNEDYIRQAFQLDVAAYVPKECEFAILLAAISAAASGKRYLAPPITDVIANACAIGSSANITNSYDLLTDREREVLQLIADGLKNTEVSKRLFISCRTVESHRASLMRKLKLKNEAEIVRYAVEKGLLNYKLSTPSELK